jgi:tetratricopeptide (TPR) repeat protein
MAGLALGPLAVTDCSGKGRLSDAPQGRIYSGVEVALAAFLVAAIVIPNATRYQACAARVSRFADALEDGSRHEKAADWKAAEHAYSAAAVLAGSHDENKNSAWRESIDAAPYYSNAAAVYDLKYVYKNLALGHEVTDPRAVAEYAWARIVMAQGQIAEAIEHLDRVLVRDDTYAMAWYAKAECCWAAGEFAKAVDAYARAAAVVAAAGNETYAEMLNAQARRIAEIERQVSATPEATLEAARLWRLRGRWDTALALYHKVAANAPDEADAHYHLGVDAEIHGRKVQAISEYETALRLLPNHYESAQGLRRLRGTSP